MQSKMLYAAASLALSLNKSQVIHGQDVHVLTVKQSEADQTGEAYQSDLDAAYEAGWKNTPLETAGETDDCDDDDASDDSEAVIKDMDAALTTMTASRDELQCDLDAANEALEGATHQVETLEAEIEALKAAPKTDPKPKSKAEAKPKAAKKA